MQNAAQAVYTPGGLMGEVLISLICLKNLGLKIAPGDKTKTDNPYSVMDLQNFVTCLLTEYPFPYNSLILSLKENPEIVQ